MDAIQSRFDAYDRANPQVYAALVKLARRFIRREESRGRVVRRIGVKMLFEAMRYFGYVEAEAQGEYRWNNNFTAPYARKIVANEPDLAPLIETRARRSETPEVEWFPDEWIA